ncbi:periplasmic heavy metal sensor [Desulfovibrio aminophilus]|nr:periplasmic heavy metal sensor [Desulfovibrio aminophilus]MCM0755623.1 periplasmic heavy metal sensor [Desulfovibrio aminophilus]
MTKTATRSAWYLGLALSMVLGLAAASYAFGGYGHGMGPGYGMMNDYAQLTPEKRAAVDKLFAEHRKAVQPLRDELFIKQAELDAVERQQNPDLNAVRTLAKDITVLRGKLADQRDAFRAKVEKETGIEMGPGRGYGMGYGHGYGHDGYGMGYGRGMGSGGGCGRW